MNWARFYTRADRNIFEGVRFRTVSNEAWQEYTVPRHWPQAAVDILLGKVFYQGSLPAMTRKIEEPGMPAWLWRSTVDDAALDGISAEWRYRVEKDIRDVLHRMAGALTYQAWKSGLMSDEEQAKIFYDEFRYILLHQMAAPELKLWMTLGLDWAYGLTEGVCAPEQKIAAFDTEASHALRRIKILGETRALEQDANKIAITLPVESSDSAAFIGWKRESDLRHAAENLGQQALETGVHFVMDAHEGGDFSLEKAMTEARQSGISEEGIRLAVRYAEQGFREISFPAIEEKTGEQCIKAVLSVPDEFIEAAVTGHSFQHQPAQRIWEQLAEAVWASGQPVVSFRSSIDAASAVGGGLACDSTGGFIFMPGSAAPSATINILACKPSSEALPHVTRMMITALESASPASGHRPVMLGITNISSWLMGQGIAYDSEAGRTTVALATALVSGSAYQASAEMAAKLGAFPAYAAAAKTYLQHIRDKITALGGASVSQKGMTRRPLQLRTAFCPDAALVEAVIPSWENAYRLGKTSGFRHAHLTGIGADATVQSLLGAATQDIMPEMALVRFDGYCKELTPAVEAALVQLGYAPQAREEMHFYAIGHATLIDAPHINHKTLRAKGFYQAALDALEAALAQALHIRYAFNKWTLGEEFCCRVLGFSMEDLDCGTFDILEALGFTEQQIEAANIYCCGKMSLEGAPALKPAHAAVFETRISAEAQIKMQAAAETFLSGGAAHTVTLDHYTTIEEVQKLLLTGWELGVKHLSLYRDGCSLLHPVALPLYKKETEEEISCPKQSRIA